MRGQSLKLKDSLLTPEQEVELKRKKRSEKSTKPRNLKGLDIS
jgi:hypothetical protein